jgi:hypothetical protein
VTSFTILTQHYSGDKIRKRIKWGSDVALGGGGGDRNVYRLLPCKPAHLEDLGVDGRIILKWILDGVDCMNLTQGSNNCRTVAYIAQ